MGKANASDGKRQPACRRPHVVAIGQELKEPSKTRPQPRGTPHVYPDSNAFLEVRGERFLRRTLGPMAKQIAGTGKRVYESELSLS